MIQTLRHKILQLAQTLEKLSPQAYASPIPALGGATIGAHARHVTELLAALLRDYEGGVVDYDRRERNQQIEKESAHAAAALQRLVEGLPTEDKPLVVRNETGGGEAASSYHRELQFNLEHCVHHEALMNVAFHHLGISPESEGFGVAPSTLKWRAECAQ